MALVPKSIIVLTAAVAALFVSVPLMAMPVLAQSDSSSDGTSMDIEAGTQYGTTYSVDTADIIRPLTVSIENHLYYPGDQVKVEGLLWLEVVKQVDAIDLVKVELKDDKGNVVAREDASLDKSEGQYATSLKLLDSASTGTYTVETRVELDADALGIVKTITSAALQSSMQFAVANPTEHEVNAENQNFTVSIASNSGINDFAFKQHEKKISFFVEGISDTIGVTEITVPKKLLSGDMTILIDQNVVAKEDVLLKSDTEAETTFEINYKHSIHRVEVAGTNVVPEFPVTLLIMAATIGSMIAATALKQRVTLR